MPETPLPVDYSNYYRRLFRQFLQDLFKLGSGQVIGVLLSIAILALQIYYGLIPRTLTPQSVASVGWPYLVLIGGLCLLSAFRAPAQIDAESQRLIKTLSEQLELPNKALADHLRGLLAQVSENAKTVLRFVLLHEEIDTPHLKIEGLSFTDTQKAQYECVTVGLIRINQVGDPGPFSLRAMLGAHEFYYVPPEFRPTLQRLLYTSTT
jgi:hypothetical protein